MTRLGRLVTFAGGCALVLSVQACSSGASPSAASAPSEAVPSVAAPSVAAPSAAAPPPATSVAPTPEATSLTPSATVTEAPAGPGVLPGLNRQVVFGTVESGGAKVLTIGSSGVVELGAYSDRSLFVAVPIRPGAEKFLLKTGKLRTGGEAWCLQVHSPGGNKPLQLKIDGCDAGAKDQVFTFPEPVADSPGRYLEVAGLFALADPSDGHVIVQESGEGDFMTNFTVVDKGKANIPALD